MADLREDIKASEQEKLDADKKLKTKRLKELNKFHRQKVEIEVLKPVYCDIDDPNSVRKVVGTLTVIDRRSNSCTIDNPKPQESETISISWVASIRRI